MNLSQLKCREEQMIQFLFFIFSPELDLEVYKASTWGRTFSLEWLFHTFFSAMTSDFEGLIRISAASGCSSEMEVANRKHLRPPN